MGGPGGGDGGSELLGEGGGGGGGGGDEARPRPAGGKGYVVFQSNVFLSTVILTILSFESTTPNKFVRINYNTETK